MRLKILAMIAALVILAGCAARQSEPQRLEVLKSDLQTVLAENPDLVLDALKQRSITVYEIVMDGVKAKKKKEAEERLAREMENPYKPVLDSSRPFLGPADAPLTVVVYSNFMCSHCNQAGDSLRFLHDREPERFRMFLKHAPFDDVSLMAALYFEAMGRIDVELAWKFHDMVFDRQEALSQQGEAALKQVVEELGVNPDRIAEQLQDQSLVAAVQGDLDEFFEFGFDGTPIILINGVSMHGSYPPQEIKEVMDMVQGKTETGEQKPETEQ